MDKLLEAQQLKKYFHTRGFFSTKKALVHAVDGISFSVNKGETLGIVGESGSGKTTLGRLVLRLVEPTEGEVFFSGINIMNLNTKSLRKLRQRTGIVFQDPQASLNPRTTIEETLSRPLIIHKSLGGRKEQQKLILSVLERVGLGSEHLGRYPHELSGGQQQRISIARAIILNPEFIVLDEPTSALDVSVQAKVLNLLVALRKEFDLTYLFISHDLTVIQHICDRVAVMYLGKIVELATTKELFENMKHPYIKALLSAAPVPDPKKRGRERILLAGEIPSPINPPAGCRFHPRCPQKIGRICEQKHPKLINVGGEHMVACHLYQR